MSVCQLISFLFCSRYTRDASPVYMLVTTDTMLGLGGERFILSFLCLYFVNRDSSSVRFFNTSVYHVRDGGESFLSSFISCIKIILKYSAYQCCMPPMAD